MVVDKKNGKVVCIECKKDFGELLYSFLSKKDFNSFLERSIALQRNHFCTRSKQLSPSSYPPPSLSYKPLPLDTLLHLPFSVSYSCQRPLLDCCYAERDVGYKAKISFEDYLLRPMDPRCYKIGEVSECSGFVKRGKTFMVSDDLTITPMNLSSNILTLKKLTSDLDDIEEYVIKISKTEAIKLLRASFMSSTALTTAFGNFLPKPNIKEERD